MKDPAGQRWRVVQNMIGRNAKRVAYSDRREGEGGFHPTIVYYARTLDGTASMIVDVVTAHGRGGRLCLCETVGDFVGKLQKPLGEKVFAIFMAQEEDDLADLYRMREGLTGIPLILVLPDHEHLTRAMNYELPLTSMYFMKEDLAKVGDALREMLKRSDTGGWQPDEGSGPHESPSGREKELPESCSSSGSSVVAGNGKKHVTFRFHGPDAEKVFLVGDFNDWDAGARALKRYEDGTWKTTISLMPGVYEYKFVIDGDWQPDPQCSESVANEFGSWNSIVRVKEKKGKHS
ncbi:MAG: glycogen branching enzyme [Syntrophorhabdus sp. PtaU1.Bin153]|nr:MAG: glycogen branching enzyme [Syntrophorhabdus sp. PtaU1.Bin153]